MELAQSYGYVVVGGGSAGCVVSARLAAKGYDVLLLEAGPGAEENPVVLDANGFTKAFSNDDLMYDRLSEKDRYCGNRRLYMGSGRGMGGSGSVNGMVYTRGDKSDYEQWPSGWQWQDVLPHFEAVEKQLGVRTRAATRFTSASIQASVQAGFQHKDGLNDGNLCGYIGHETMNYAGAMRRSSYASYIHDDKPDSLTVITGAAVKRILFEGNRAVKVEFQKQNRLYQVQVDHEVIMAAGALETPKLLMLSGVGPIEQLKKFNIRPVILAPEIGKNLQDHPNVCLFYRGKQNLDCYYPQLYGFDRVNQQLNLANGQPDTCYVFYSAPASIKQSMQRMLPALVLPQVLYRYHWLRKLLRHVVNGMFLIPGVKVFTSKLYGIVVILGKPVSRGEIHLASVDAAEPPLVYPGYFSNQQDLETLYQGVLRAKEIMQQNAMRLWGAVGLSAAARTNSEQSIKSWIKTATMTTFHYCGTCRMGADDRAPVGIDLKLKGSSNVRVVDASVIPEIPVSALNAPTMMIAHRAADIIMAQRVPKNHEQADHFDKAGQA